jgi:molecular chaperone DnaK (HSP70)
MMPARYVVGIDLGTTNCAAAYVDTAGDSDAIAPLPITQVVGAGEIDQQPMLPSFLLLATEHEVPRASIALPWNADTDSAVGTFARDRGAELPHRLVSSAKSWLSHSDVDRTAAILPWHADDEERGDGRRVSPVQASASYLAHIRAAWKDAIGTPLEDQEILLTVPASFDAIARELTVTAARHRRRFIPGWPAPANGGATSCTRATWSSSVTSGAGPATFR